MSEPFYYFVFYAEENADEHDLLDCYLTTDSKLSNNRLEAVGKETKAPVT